MGEPMTKDAAAWKVRAVAAEAEVERLTRERDEAVHGRAEERSMRNAGVVAADATIAAERVRANAAESERDRLAAALAEVREAAWLVLPDRDAILGGAERWRRLRLACEAIPADLAAAHDARVRAEALREAADRMEAADLTLGSGEDMPAVWLRAEADRIERGGR